MLAKFAQSGLGATITVVATGVSVARFGVSTSLAPSKYGYRVSRNCLDDLKAFLTDGQLPEVDSAALLCMIQTHMGRLASPIYTQKHFICTLATPPCSLAVRSNPEPSLPLLQVLQKLPLLMQYRSWWMQGTPYQLSGLLKAAHVTLASQQADIAALRQRIESQDALNLKLKDDYSQQQVPVSISPCLVVWIAD